MIPLNQNLNSLQRSGIRVFTNLARQTPGCSMLTIGEPDQDTPDSIKQAVIAAVEANMTHYPPNQGTEHLRQAIADFETRRGNVTKPEQVLVTVGATQALFTALFGVLNPGEEVIVLTPAFSLYESIITIAGAKMVPIDMTKTNFQLTKEALEAAITPKTKAIVLNSPCNPTGTVLNVDSMAAVKEAILGKPIFAICDNVYNQLSYGDCPDLTLDVDLKDQLILSQSFSKPYAMTGWRVGYLVCPDYVMDRLLLLGAANISSIPTFVQEAAVTALTVDTTEVRELYRKRRDYMCARLKAMGLDFPEPMGAFYVFPNIERFGMTSSDFCMRMIREGKLAAVPGSCFGTEGYIRLSYCYSDEELKTGLDKLEAFIRSL